MASGHSDNLGGLHGSRQSNGGIPKDIEEPESEDRQILTEDMEENGQTKEKRVRTLTEKGNEQYNVQRQKLREKLFTYRRNLQEMVTEFATHQQEDRTVYVAKKFELKNLFTAYEVETGKYLDFLTRTNTESSLSERDSEEIIFRTVKESVHTVQEEMTALIEQRRDNGKAKSVRSHAKSNRSRVSGTSESTELARQRAKAEAAKARLTFERRELEMKKDRLSLLVSRHLIQIQAAR